MRRFSQLPDIATTDALAEWLHLSPGELDWFCDTCSNTARSQVRGKLHYRHAWIAKRSGGLRLLEIPKARLKRMQRRMLDELLARVPVSEHVMGFTRGRSCIDHARAHVGAAWLVTLDLSDWFGRIPRSRIGALGVRPAARAGSSRAPARHRRDHRRRIGATTWTTIVVRATEPSACGKADSAVGYGNTNRLTCRRPARSPDGAQRNPGIPGLVG